MVYRCERCGKPHARDDPPCTDCGYDSFKQYDEETSATVETGPNFVWACSDCGRQHVKHTPPCSRCGSQELEKIEPSYEQLDRDLERRTGWKSIARPYLPLMVLIAIAGLGLIALIAL